MATANSLFTICILCCSLLPLWLQILLIFFCCFSVHRIASMPPPISEVAVYMHVSPASYSNKFMCKWMHVPDVMICIKDFLSYMLTRMAHT